MTEDVETRRASVSSCTHSTTSRRGGSHSTIVIGSPTGSSSCVIVKVPVAPGARAPS